MDVVGPGEQVVEEILLHWAIDSGGGRCRREGRCRVGEGGTFLGDTHRGVVRLGEGDVTSLLMVSSESLISCELDWIGAVLGLISALMAAMSSVLYACLHSSMFSNASLLRTLNISVLTLSSICAHNSKLSSRLV